MLDNCFRILVVSRFKFNSLTLYHTFCHNCSVRGMKVNLFFFLRFLFLERQNVQFLKIKSAQNGRRKLKPRFCRQKDRESISSLRQCVKIGSIEREMSNLGKIKKQPANRIDSLSNRAAAGREPCHRSRFFHR